MQRMRQSVGAANQPHELVIGALGSATAVANAAHTAKMHRELDCVCVSECRCAREHEVQEAEMPRLRDVCCSFSLHIIASSSILSHTISEHCNYRSRRYSTEVLQIYFRK